MLLACLNLVEERPPYDGRYDAEPLLRLLPFISDSPFVTVPGMSPAEEWAAMAKGVHRAPDADIERRAGAANLWWWRAVSESLVRRGSIERRKLTGILRDGAAKSRSLGIPYTDDGDDFKAFSKTPYAALTAEEHRAVSAIAEARVRAYRFVQATPLGQSPHGLLPSFLPLPPAGEGRVLGQALLFRDARAGRAGVRESPLGDARAGAAGVRASRSRRQRRRPRPLRERCSSSRARRPRTRPAGERTRAARRRRSCRPWDRPR